jgi:hypothetical protein
MPTQRCVDLKKPSTLIKDLLQVSLLILNSVSFLFQSGQNLTIPSKSAILERIKQTLAQAAASRNLTVNVIDSTRLPKPYINTE